MSVPPPSASAAPPDGAPAEAPRELVVRLEEPRGRRRRGVAGAHALRFSPAGLVIEHDGALVAPLVVPLGSLALAAIDAGPAKAGHMTGRLPVLRRLSQTAVVPREEGIEGWLWTSRDGSLLPSLAEQDAPNGVLLFTKPLGGEVVTRSFAPDWVAALAARSPLGEPAVPGLLLRLADTVGADEIFHRYGIARPLTDREVPPAMRRSLPTDVPADPVLRRSGEDPRAGTSVAPPGMR
ncbi:MAG: hypothetical protein ACR2L8_05640 [Solirubrobacteraceae bacterium]